MSKSYFEETIKTGSFLIVFLVSILAIFVLINDVQGTSKIIESIIIIMLVLSVITAIWNFVKKNF